jgi:ParB/RepB/Spo0J family partition protein
MATVKTPHQNLQLLNVSDIRPCKLIDQSRDRAALASSIASAGPLQNIMVRPVRKKYELVFGSGRWQEAKRNGQKQIWALVRQCTDKELLLFNAMENFARSNLSPIQEGELLKKLHEAGYSTRQLEKNLGISHSQIVQRVKLVEVLPAQAKRAIDSGRLAPSTFEYVRTKVKDPELQAQVFDRVVKGDLDLDSTIEIVEGLSPTDEICKKSEPFKDSNAKDKPRTETVTTTIEVRQSRVVRGPDGSILVQDSENHRDRNLPEELTKAWEKLREHDLVEFLFRHTRSVSDHQSGYTVTSAEQEASQ